jgi:hypothetical protein
MKEHVIMNEETGELRVLLTFRYLTMIETEYHTHKFEGIYVETLEGWEILGAL